MSDTEGYSLCDSPYIKGKQILSDKKQISVAWGWGQRETWRAKGVRNPLEVIKLLSFFVMLVSWMYTTDKIYQAPNECIYYT